VSGFSTIRLDKSLPVARLTLARPERLNSFTREMLDEIASALEELRVTPGIRCLVISGEGSRLLGGPGSRRA
jgi:enoyl-CoA hydratase/carnithine racemase